MKTVRMVNTKPGHQKFGQVEEFTEHTAKHPLTKKDGWIAQPVEKTEPVAEDNVKATLDIEDMKMPQLREYAKRFPEEEWKSIMKKDELKAYIKNKLQ